MNELELELKFPCVLAVNNFKERDNVFGTLVYHLCGFR